MPVMSPERPPSQNSGVGNNNNNNSNAIEPTNMVLSTIPRESGHVVIHQQNARVRHQPNQAQSVKTIASSTTSSPSKYVVIHQNGNGQYRTSDGTTAYLTTQSNGVGNIVLLATEPMAVSGSDQNVIVNTNGSDEELTSLTWLQDRNLIKGIVACTNSKTVATSPTRHSNSVGPLSPTSDFLEDSSVSEDNASSANSSSDQGISINSIEYSPTTPNGTFTSYHSQYHPVVTTTTTSHPHHVQYTNNNSVTKNRNHLLSPTKTTVTTAVPTTAYTAVASLQHLNTPKTLMYNGPSGTTTVVEYNGGMNFNQPSPTRQVHSQMPMSPQLSSLSQQSTAPIISSSTSQTLSPTSTSTAAHHQHFHKKYLREQMNGSESSGSNSVNGISVECRAITSQQPQQQFYSSAVIESEDYHRTPVKTESFAFNSNNDNEDMLMARESLNFDSPGATANGKSVNGSSQKAPSSTTSSAAASPKQKHPTNVPYDPMKHTTNKPPYSFSSLIFMAIEDSPEKALPVKEIYAWIVQHFPYFKTAPAGWKNSVRHNLSLNKSFLKVEKAPNMGKGSLWRVEQQQRHNLLQALARSPFHQCSAVDKFSPYKTNPSTPRMSDSPPPTPAKTNLDPELFPKLWKTMKDMVNKEVNDSSAASPNERDECHHPQFAFNSSREYFANGVASGEENPNANRVGMLDYSIERLARDCGADSIDDVHAATAMLALKHGPNVFSEHFQNGSPVITSSPSEDHTYSAGGGAGGGGSSTPATHSQNGSENGICSDAAYESSDERSHLHHELTSKELEERRRHAEGVDALLSFASSAASSPAKRPSSTSLEDEHISSYMENIPHFGPSQNGGTTTIITNEDGESILYHQRPSTYETQSYFHHLSLPSAAKKLKHSRSIRTKLKRKTTLIR